MCRDTTGPLRHCDCPYDKEELMLKLEVGKTYVDRLNRKVEIIYNNYKGTANRYIGVQKSSSDVILFYKETGEWTRHESECDLVKEYVEPVIHRRDIIWYRATTGEVCVVMKMVGDHLVVKAHTELHRQTVEYTEKA
jgi:hypothetical protein